MLIACINKNCGTRLRVPDGKQGKVTCPMCRTSFDWPNRTLEIREIDFLCAAAGRKSTLVFARESAADKYSLRGIDPDNGSIVARGEAWKAAEKARLDAAARAVRRRNGALAAATQLGRDLLRWASTKAEHRAHADAEEATVSGPPPAFNTADFDWAGVDCPHCGCKGPQVVLCGVCREIVCRGRCIKKAGGAEYFTCRDGCDGHGRLPPPAEFNLSGKELAIDHAAGVVDEIGAAALGEEKRKALPAPSKVLPPPSSQRRR